MTIFFKRSKKGGFAALLFVISISISLMMILIAASDTMWLLQKDVQFLGDRTERQLAAESCRQLALLYIAEDPDYDKPKHFEFDDKNNQNNNEKISCDILSISRIQSSSPFSDRSIITSGYYRGGTSTMESSVHITNHGLVEGYKYYK